MQTHSLKAAYKNYVRARLQGAEHMTGLGKKELKRMAANTGAMVDSESPSEVRHLLTDYQNNNEVICSKVMTRARAAYLNTRLHGTGLAFAVKTGY